MSSIQTASNTCANMPNSEYVQILQKITQLQEQFDVKVKYDKNKDAQIDKLYEENQQYKEQLIWRLKKDLLEDVIDQIEAIKKMRAAFNTPVQSRAKKSRAPKDPSVKLLEFVDTIVSDLVRMLENHGVYSFTVESDDFNPKLQQPVGKIMTNDASLNRKVIRIRDGFEYRDEDDRKLLRKELVKVYSYCEKPASTENTAPSKDVKSSPKSKRKWFGRK